MSTAFPPVRPFRPRERREPFRDAGGMAALVVLALLGAAGVGGWEIVDSFARRARLLEAGVLATYSSPGEDTTLLRTLLLLFIQLLVMLTMMAWVFRANKNARALGARYLAFSPGWSAAWFLIPIASLFMPFFVLRDVWNGSRDPAGRKSSTTPLALILAYGLPLLCLPLFAHPSLDAFWQAEQIGLAIELGLKVPAAPKAADVAQSILVHCALTAALLVGTVALAVTVLQIHRAQHSQYYSLPTLERVPAANRWPGED